MMQVETFDTQMHFPSDLDVQMQGSTADHWYRNEAAMEEDDTFPAESTGISIEVDMEEPQEGNSEYYEMDDQEYAVDEPNDIEISEAPTPHANYDNPTVAIEQNHASVAVEDAVPTEQMLPPLEQADDSFDLLAYDAYDNGSEQPLASEQPNPEHFDQKDSVHEAVVPENEQVPDTFHEPEIIEEVAHEQSSDQLRHDSSAEEPHEEPYETNEADNAEVPYTDPSAEAVGGALVSEVPRLEEVEQTDPHEISEGVYIDPPPAVLITLPSSDFPEVSLFNLPETTRHSTSPPPEGLDSAHQALTILLQDRPTLYYEPLFAVFEALRQEEQISHVIEGELVLNAYDLQLSISEDNVYTREVTLHDLNVLHDGSDFAGPLRLKLESIMPRFIERYHLLQDQVSRLDLVEAGLEAIELPQDQVSRLDLAEAGLEAIELPQEESYDDAHDQTADDEAPQEEQHDAEAETDKYPDPEGAVKDVEELGEQNESNQLQDVPDHEYSEEQDQEGSKHDDSNQLQDVPDHEYSEEQEGSKHDDSLHPVNADNYDAAETAEKEDNEEGEISEEVTTGQLDESQEPTDTFEQLPVPFDYPEESAHNAGQLDELQDQADDIEQTPVQSDLNPEDTHEIGNSIQTLSSEDHNPDEDGAIAEHPEIKDSVDNKYDEPSNVEHPLESTTDEPLDSSFAGDIPQNEDYAEAEDDISYDDNLDGDGEVDFEAEKDDASDKSSATLSSTSTAKRTFDDVDPDDEPETIWNASPESPGHKRPRLTSD